MNQRKKENSNPCSMEKRGVKHYKGGASDFKTGREILSPLQRCNRRKRGGESAQAEKKTEDLHGQIKRGGKLTSDGCCHRPTNGRRGS